MHKPIIGGSAGVQRWRRQCSSGNDTGVQFKTPTLFNFTDATVHFKATYSRSALEWILDQYREKKPKDPTIAEKFNTYRFADYKEQVIDLLKRVCTVSVQTMQIKKQMET